MSKPFSQTDILLEAGTNELEVLVFRQGELNCGVNVAKVREVIGSFERVSVPKTHPAVVGVFNLRGSVIPLVDLQLYFKPGTKSDAALRNVIVTEFNNTRMGFIVDAVERIYRLSWDAVLPLPHGVASSDTALTGICRVRDDYIVMMVDFEKIAFDIHGCDVKAQAVGAAAGDLQRGAQRILVAEDSPTTRGFIVQTLHGAGYTNVLAVENGALAWEQIERTRVGDAPLFDIIVSDIEMPQMDGLHLCRRLKEDERLSKTPIVVFSSLVSQDNANKLTQVGADVALTKPQLVELVGVVDGLLARGGAAVPAAAQA